MEGWQVWDLMMKGVAQIRFCHTIPVGLDMAAIFDIGAAIGYDLIAVAELLPACESGVVAALNEKLKD